MLHWGLGFSWDWGMVDEVLLCETVVSDDSFFQLELQCCCVSLVLSLWMNGRSGIGFVSSPPVFGACSDCRGVLLCRCYSLRLGRVLLCRSPLCLLKQQLKIKLRKYLGSGNLIGISLNKQGGNRVLSAFPKLSGTPRTWCFQQVSGATGSTACAGAPGLPMLVCHKGCASLGIGSVALEGNGLAREGASSTTQALSFFLLPAPCSLSNSAPTQRCLSLVLPGLEHCSGDTGVPCSGAEGTLCFAQSGP